jgi:hypothetical protein
LQEVGTGAGKCLAGDTIIAVEIDDNCAFGKFTISKLLQEHASDVTGDNTCI